MSHQPYPTSPENFAAAAEIGMSKTKLRKRLMESRSLLTDQIRKNFTFKGVMFDFEKQRLWSDDRSMFLQWKNDGETNRGSVCLYEDFPCI
jgi:hypothetical protein